MDNNDEFSYILNRLNIIQSTRNTLLTFSFTTVLALIGIAFANLDKELPASLYLFPYFLIIPFAARITYYRISDAHWSAYINIFYPDKMRLYRYTNFVRERQRQSFRVISLLVNSEMIILAFACNMLFYMFSLNNPIRKILFIISAFLFFFVIFLVYQGYNYGKIKGRYKLKWKLAKLRYEDTFYQEPESISIYICEVCKKISSNMVGIFSLSYIDDVPDIAKTILQILSDDKYIKYTLNDDLFCKIEYRFKFRLAKMIGFNFYFKYLAP